MTQADHSDQGINFEPNLAVQYFNGDRFNFAMEGRCIASLTNIDAAHLNPLGLVHGGLCATMLDVAMAMSGSFRPAPFELLPGS